MKGIQVGIIGICISMFSVALATNHPLIIGGTFAGLTVAVMGCFIKDK